MADTFLFGSDNKQIKDREALEAALNVQPNKDQYKQHFFEIGNAMVLAEIWRILQQLVIQEELAYPIRTVEELIPLVQSLPGVRIDWARQSFKSDDFPMSQENFLSKCQRAIEEYHNIQEGSGLDRPVRPKRR